MDLNEARELVKSPLWPKVRDSFLETGTLEVYPAGDLRRLAYLDQETRDRIELWKTALGSLADWRKVVSGTEVRALKAQFPGVYPEALRYEMYFRKFGDLKKDFPEEAVKLLLKLQFPEAYELCCS